MSFIGKGLNSFFKGKKHTVSNDADRSLPNHIGIIMDGNGRWAKNHNRPRTYGHSQGSAKFREITRYCDSIGLKYLTVYAFSTENWRRPQSEVAAIMKIFKEYMEEALSDFTNENIVIRFIGDRSPLAPELVDLMNRCEQATKDKTGLVCNIAVNYGGRQEIVFAAQRIAQKCLDGLISPSDITEDMISSHTYTAGQNDPDLIIRPSGEKRISNFLIWQSAYTEYYFDDILWPDYTVEALEEAISEFNKRNRRFGGI